jgi:hypothetical protein
MADIFNYKKNFTKIIVPELKDLSFKKVGEYYVKRKDNFIEKILIQRSRFNNSYYSHQFYVDTFVEFESGDTSHTSMRFDRPSKIKIPEAEKNITLNILNNIEPNYIISKEQQEERNNYRLSRMWLYASEDELIILLNELKYIIIPKFSECFNAMKKFLSTEEKTINVIREIREIEMKLNGDLDF